VVWLNQVATATRDDLDDCLSRCLHMRTSYHEHPRKARLRSKGVEMDLTLWQLLTGKRKALIAVGRMAKLGSGIQGRAMALQLGSPQMRIQVSKDGSRRDGSAIYLSSYVLNADADFCTCPEKVSSVAGKAGQGILLVASNLGKANQGVRQTPGSSCKGTIWRHQQAAASGAGNVIGPDAAFANTARHIAA